MPRSASRAPPRAGIRRGSLTSTGTALSLQLVFLPKMPPSSLSIRKIRTFSVGVSAWRLVALPVPWLQQAIPTSRARKGQRGRRQRRRSDPVESDPVEDLEGEGESMVSVRLMVFFLDDLPARDVEVGEVGVSRDLGLDSRQVDPVRLRQGFAEDLRASGDEG